MLLAEQWAVITPPGRKLPSSKEQGNSACELTGVSGKRKAAGQADGIVCGEGGRWEIHKNVINNCLHTCLAHECHEVHLHSNCPAPTAPPLQAVSS